jgi:hypothetical protein
MPFEPAAAVRRLQQPEAAESREFARRGSTRDPQPEGAEAPRPCSTGPNPDPATRSRSTRSRTAGSLLTPHNPTPRNP